jgi:uncharacterized protein (DUF934 family)
MALLERGRPIEDRWRRIADGAPIPADVPALVPLARLRLEWPEGRAAPLGALIGPATQAGEIADLLPQLALIAVEFPKFRDGRGFTLARTLRERYGFAGEVRAVGHVLPDQHRFLLRCGFTSVEVPDGADLEAWTAALGRFPIAYQTAVADDRPLRRRLRPGQ